MVHITNAEIMNAITKLKSPKLQPKENVVTAEEKGAVTAIESDNKIKQPMVKDEPIPVAKKTGTNNSKIQPTKLAKNYQTVLPDGSIRIQLRHSSDEVEDDIIDMKNSQCGPTLNQSNGMEKIEEIVVTPTIQQIGPLEPSPIKPIAKSIPSNSSNISVNPNQSIVPERSSTASSKQTSQEDTNIASTAAENGSVRAMTKERKRILFTTKIGSGSEEQIFATQLSLSKTDSLSSQLSGEQGTLLESPSSVDRIDTVKQVTTVQQHTVPEEPEPIIRMRSKEDKNIKESGETKTSVDFKNRHSRYIQNIEEIMEEQKRLDASRKYADVEETEAWSSVPESSPPAHAEKKVQKFIEQHMMGSSGSEHDSEADSKVG